MGTIDYGYVRKKDASIWIPTRQFKVCRQGSEQTCPMVMIYHRLLPVVGPKMLLPLLAFMRENERSSMKSIRTLKVVL